MTTPRNHTPAPCVQCGCTDYVATKKTQRFCSHACWGVYDSIHKIRRDALGEVLQESGLGGDLDHETGGECRALAQQQGGACEFGACRYHNGPSATDATRCALIVASARGGLGQVEVARIMGVTKQRVFSIEKRALKKLRSTRGSGRLKVFA